MRNTRSRNYTYNKPRDWYEHFFVFAYYEELPCIRIAALLGRSQPFVRGCMIRLGITVSEEVKEKFSKLSRFKFGSTPFNKGMRMFDYSSKEGIKKWKAACFKKGSIPHNKYPIGTIRKRHKGKGRQYLHIRVSNTEWMLLHQYKWEKKYGPIPSTHILRFKNGNSLDTRFRNLKLVSLSELAKIITNSDGRIAAAILGNDTEDKQLFNAIKNNKPLLNLKRKQLQLNKAIYG